MTSQKDAYKMGYEHGFSIASYQDIPELGQKLPRHVDWEGIGTVNSLEDAQSAFLMLCADAEENSRQYSPFEFTAEEFNRSRNPDAVWEKFDAGIHAGFLANWDSRMSSSGYTDCACRDCFEIAIGTPGFSFCHACETAGCEPNSECSCEPEMEEETHA